MIKTKLEELFAKYILEPSIVDVYVEGNADVQFYKHHLLRMGYSLRFVDISTIEFSIDLSQISCDLENNNRDRIIFLIDELHRKQLDNNVYGIIDRDILEYTRCLPNNDHVFLTDYSCLEMYYILEDNITKIHNEISNVFTPDLINCALLSASEFSHLLIVEKQHGLSIKKIKETNFHRYFCREQSIIKWNDYLNACLNNSNLVELCDVITGETKRIQELLKSIDFKMYVNGHMFFMILSFLAKQKGYTTTNESLCELFRASVETSFLEHLNLFMQLKAIA